MVARNFWPVAYNSVVDIKGPWYLGILEWKRVFRMLYSTYLHLQLYSVQPLVVHVAGMGRPDFLSKEQKKKGGGINSSPLTPLLIWLKNCDFFSLCNKAIILVLELARKADTHDGDQWFRKIHNLVKNTLWLFAKFCYINNNILSKSKWIFKMIKTELSSSKFGS